MLYKHVKIASNNSVVKMLVKSSKTDQWAEGVELYIGKATSRWKNLCPVRAMKLYLTKRGKGGGPLFRWSSGQAVTASCYTRLFKQLVSLGGMPSGVYRLTSCLKRRV